MTFIFKHFSVEDDLSTMRVGAEAMILGAWVRPPETGKIFEIGTGCGVISLMLAQKCSSQITAIDIDPDSARQAEENFRKSLWKERLASINVSFEDFIKQNTLKFDLVISNPPFFTGSIHPPSEKRAAARHDKDLSFEEITSGTAGILNDEGFLAVILPEKESERFEKLAVKNGLYTTKILKIFTKESDKEPVRRIITFSLKPSETEDNSIIIRNSDGSFTYDYLGLTAEYHSFRS